MWHPTVDQQVAAIATIAAVASAFYAWRSHRTASKALKIAEAEHGEKHSGLSAYMIDGVAWDTENSERLISFACSISNIANAPLSITTSDLHVFAYNSDGNMSEIVLKQAGEGSPAIWNITRLAIPADLPPRSTLSGWITFRIPDRVLDSMSIDRYQLQFKTSTGERATLDKYIVQRITNG